MSTIFPAFYAPTRTLLMMLRSIVSCLSLAMATVSPTIQTSLLTPAAVSVARSHMRTSCGTSFKEGAGAVLCLMELDMEDLRIESDLGFVVGPHECMTLLRWVEQNNVLAIICDCQFSRVPWGRAN